MADSQRTTSPAPHFRAAHSKRLRYTNPAIRRVVASQRANAFRGVFRRALLIAAALCFLAVFSPIASAYTPVTDCSQITGYGNNTYQLVANITNGCEITGLTYSFGWVSVDCAGYSITGIRTSTGVFGTGGSTPHTLYVHNNTGMVWLLNCNIGDGTAANSGAHMYWDCGHAINSGLNAGLISNSHINLHYGSVLIADNCNGMTLQGSLTGGVYGQVFTTLGVVYRQNCFYCSARQMRFDHTAVDPATFEHGEPISLNGPDNSVKNVRMDGSPFVDDAIQIYNSNATHPAVVQDNSIHLYGDSTIEGIDAAGVTITGNTIEVPLLPPVGGVAFATGIGCFASAYGTAGCSPSNWTVSNNYIYGQTGARVQGFRFQGGGSGVASNLTFTGNTVSAAYLQESQFGVSGSPSNAFWSTSNIHIGNNQFGGSVVRLNGTYGTFDDGGNTNCSAVIPAGGLYCP
jgi:hypothetical protein